MMRWYAVCLALLAFLYLFCSAGLHISLNPFAEKWMSYDQLASPDGTLVVEHMSCLTCLDYAIGVRRISDPVTSDDIIVRDQGNASVVYKWDGDHRLVVAAQTPEDFRGGKPDARGARISYVQYSTSPDASRETVHSNTATPTFTVIKDADDNGGLRECRMEFTYRGPVRLTVTIGLSQQRQRKPHYFVGSSMRPTDSDKLFQPTSFSLAGFPLESPFFRSAGTVSMSQEVSAKGARLFLNSMIHGSLEPKIGLFLSGEEFVFSGKPDLTPDQISGLSDCLQ